MDKTRTLPPLVRGEVTRIFELFVDKIKFFRNILLLTDNFDLVLQVQWWGEGLPALIRPKELQINDRILKNSQFLESSFHCEKYEIKTTSELFQSYLKTCEVLELTVLEAVESYVIGSAFLRNLINLFKNNNELISMPIFDYSGEEIGELIIHVNFLEKPQKKLEIKQNENANLCRYDYLYEKSKKYDKSNDSSGVYLLLGEKTLCYNGNLTQRNYQEQYTEKLQPQVNCLDFIKNDKTRKSNLNCLANGCGPLFNQEESKSTIVGKKSSSESLPNPKVLSNLFKVMNFSLNAQKSKLRSDIKNIRVKLPRKFSSDFVKCKSKSRFLSDHSEQEEKKITKISGKSRNFPEKQAYQKKENSFNSSRVSLSEKSEISKVQQNYKLTDLQSLSSKENSNTKVLDYLLGCDMSKDNEEIALNDFKKMSPSQDLIDSISQLCLVSDNNQFTPRDRLHTESVFSKQAHLHFDFNNPIERDYYQKFFSKSNSSADFKVAEFLNHPENSFKIGRSRSNEVVPQKKSQVSSLKSCRKFSHSEDKIKNSINEDCLVNDLIINDRAKSCGCCKYYKKLSELDTIIESLKNFEQKIIKIEKYSQNPNVFYKRNQLAEDS